jgi:serine/threonine protein kinase
MAVKQVPVAQFNDPSMLDKIKALELEIDLLSCFSHPNIVRYIGTSRDKKYLNIFLEYEAGLKILFMLNYVGKGGSIAELVRKYDKFNENLIRTYTKQILQGLEYLHAHDVIHRGN